MVFYKCTLWAASSPRLPAKSVLHPTAFGPSSETRWRAFLKKHFCIKRAGISPIARRFFSCFWVMFIFFQCCTSTYFLISLLPKIAPRLCLCWMEKSPNGNTCKLAQKKPQILSGLYVPENICSYRADQLLSNSASLPLKVLLTSCFRWRCEVSALSGIQLPHSSFPLALLFDLYLEARNFVTFCLF